MVMDHQFSINGFKLEEETIFPTLKQSADVPNKFNDVNSLITHNPNAPNFDFPDDHDSDLVLKYLYQILMEENIDDEDPGMFCDPIALRAAENSFYEVLHDNNPSSHQTSNFVNQNAESPESLFSGSTDYSISSTTSDMSNGSLNSLDTQVVPSMFTDSESILQFKKGMEEASRFLPTPNQLVINLDQYLLPPKTDEFSRGSFVKIEDEMNNSSRGKKHHHPDDSELEEERRSSKHSAIFEEEEAELSEAFDKVLLSTDNNIGSIDNEMLSGRGNNGAKNGKNRAKKQMGTNETVDLRALLMGCAQSIASADYRGASEQLKKIRQHSLPTGDAAQRLANVFASGLEARLAGTGTQLYAALAPKRIKASEKLKAYRTYLSSCPFKRIGIFFAKEMIYEVASSGSTLHVIDFGILYGFQWPILIQQLSQRPGGPPRLRVTGIDHPQPGFRPAEKVEETGARLRKYCERFGVPFEYNALTAQSWETIKIEDLKLKNGEVIAVNCLFRLENLLDETVDIDSPRDSFLRLIRGINPRIFVQSVVSGSYSSPFFVTRFREALFFYSAVFDMFDATLARDDHQRLNFEQEFLGREIMNVIACEGVERLERPETYKQWQVRNMRAGFKPLPVSPELVVKLGEKVKAGYHRDFLFDEDDHWILQGWKGRILCASSCWVPSY